MARLTASVSAACCTCKSQPYDHLVEEDTKKKQTPFKQKTPTVQDINDHLDQLGTPPAASKKSAVVVGTPVNLDEQFLAAETGLHPGDSIRVIGGTYEGDEGRVGQKGCTDQMVYVDLVSAGSKRIKQSSVVKVGGPSKAKYTIPKKTGRKKKHWGKRCKDGSLNMRCKENKGFDKYND